MSTRPPRRRREPARGSNNVRTVLLGIVVIVAGLGIGMLSAVVMHRGASTTGVPAAPVVTPVPVPSAAEPLRTPPPSARPAVTLAAPATARPSATPVATPSPEPSPTASAKPTARPTPSATPAPSPTPSARATVRPTATPLPSPTPTRVPATPAAISTGFDIDIAQAVVRRYLDAIARGDDATARALLGASPGDATVPLPELAFVNSSSKFGSFVGRRTSETSAAIEVAVTNGTQKYAIVYEVVQGPKGTIISGRDITRP
jgi:hypothetical protein